MGNGPGGFSASATDMFLEAAEKLSIRLRADAVPIFARYYDELLLWNEKVNLTRITGELEVIINHFIDSLVPERFLPFGAVVADIGSGAGFPGIPLKIIRPDLEVTLFESSFKKVAFLRHVIRLLQLKGIVVSPERAGAKASGMTKYLVCIGRAVAALPAFLQVAERMVAPKGLIVAMRGARFQEELRAVEGALGGLHLSVAAVKTFTLPVSGAVRAIILFESRR